MEQTTTTKQLTCKDRIKKDYREECRQLSSLFSVMSGTYTPEELETFADSFSMDVEDLSNDRLCDKAYKALSQYGLGIDYVLPNTFTGQRKGYLRWQISWGGPSSEWRFFFVPGESDAYRIEYWFMDWADGAKVGCTGGRVAKLLWNYLQECDYPRNCYESAMQNRD